ncbi:hypothetical protein Ancab_015997 [Ancistrocladus abbreviatus]
MLKAALEVASSGFFPEELGLLKKRVETARVVSSHALTGKRQASQQKKMIYGTQFILVSFDSTLSQPNLQYYYKNLAPMNFEAISAYLICSTVDEGLLYSSHPTHAFLLM